MSDASTSLAAEGIHDNPKVTADAGVVQGTDAADAAPNGQDRPRGRAEQTIAHVRQLRAEMEMRSHPDLDPIRKARALGQLAHEALQAIDLDSRLAAATQRSPSVERTRERKQTIAHVQRVLAKEMKKVRAHPDLDPVQNAQAAARLAREARRAIELRGAWLTPSPTSAPGSRKFWNKCGENPYRKTQGRSWREFS